MSHQQLKKAIEEEWDRIEQWEVDECILGSKRNMGQRPGGGSGKDCHIQNRIQQCIDRKGLATEF